MFIIFGLPITGGHEEKTMMKVLVTGGAGYLGTTLVPQLVADGYEVIVYDRFYFGDFGLKKMPRVQCRVGDIRTITPKDLEGVEAVIDLAGLSNDPSCDLDPSLTEEINHKGSARVAWAAGEAGVARYILSSSCSVYGHGDDWLDESSPLRPLSRYAEAKKNAEQDVLGIAGRYPNTTFTVLRNPTLFGISPRMRFDLVVNIMSLHAFTQGRVYVMGTGNHWRPLIHVADVSRAFRIVLRAPREQIANEIFNVGDDDMNFRIITIAYQVKSVLPDITIDILKEDPEKRDYRVRFQKFMTRFGFRASRTVRDGVVEVVEALKSGLILPDDPRWYTLRYYKMLLDAERLFKELNIDGKIL